jgi:hypothetical protein
MNRYLLFFFLVSAVCISGLITAPFLLAGDPEIIIHVNTPEKAAFNTPEEAAKFASKLANEKAQKSFGISPFSPDSYSAQIIGSRWYWGKIEPPGIGGYSAQVEFNRDGSGQVVRAVLHTDTLYRNPNNSKRSIEMEVID